MRRMISSLFIALSIWVSAPAFPQQKAESLAEKFARPDQTVEYHFMIEVPGLKEGDLAKTFKSSIVERLAKFAKIGELKKPKPGIYVDSRESGLEKSNLIIRVRSGQITVKARAASPEGLLDLEKASSKKYEMDYFGIPEYSISSDIKFKDEEFDVRPSAWTIETLWAFIGKKSPRLYGQIEPVIKKAGKVEIPGTASMYSVDAELMHPAASRLKGAIVESGLAVWFFPPTGKYLVELAFTGLVKYRSETDKIFEDLRSGLSGAGLLKADQSSKTRQYFNAYFGEKR